MQESKFYRLGNLIYKLRWYIITIWLLSILACLPFIPDIVSPFKTTGFSNEQSESAKAEKFMNQQLGYNNYNKFIIIYNSKKLVATDPAYIAKIKKSLAGLKKFPIKQVILYPDENKKQISKDKHTAYVVIILKSTKSIGDGLLDQFKSLIKTPTGMTMQLGGEPIFVENVNKQTQTDLYKADFIATPVSIITLLLVFGSLFAAMIPIVLGGGGAIIILTSLYFFGQVFSLSIFTLNIALLLGLCLILDYSLFIISRFRDEIKRDLPINEIIAETQASAGKAIFFSGLAVFASLSALLLFPINILFSIAIGGMAAVFVAVLTAIILLPAILSVLQKNINLLSIKFLSQSVRKRLHFWHWLAEKVVYRPITFFTLSLIVLLMLGYPFLSAKFGLSDHRILPQQSEHRSFFDTYDKKFNENELTPIQLLVHTDKNTIYSRSNISKLYDLTKDIKAIPGVKQVNSIVTTDSKITKDQYYSLYKMRKNLDPSLKKLLDTTTRSYFTVVNIISKHSANSNETKKLISKIETVKIGKNMSKQLTGTPVNNVDILNSINQSLPLAILWIMVFTYLILLVLLRSLFLPIKAILMNILSLSACYGALVLVFQDGYLHQFLNFEPQGMLDISLLVIIFCALFGFSMDYEVFLLTRIKEAYEITGDNEKSIIFGIEKSSRIITSAAIIVIIICCSFLVADILMVKAFGLGIAVAIFVDAFLIRTILVPSTMALVKKLNWYLPKWLDKILPRL